MPRIPRPLTNPVISFVAGIATAGLMSGCNPSTARPSFSPLTGAVIDTVLVAPELAIEAVRSRLEQDSVTVRRYHQGDGFLETDRLDYPEVAGEAQVVRLRVWADPAVGGRARVTIEITFHWTADPSRLPRDREHHVGPDHPARQYVIDMMRSVKEALAP